MIVTRIPIASMSTMVTSAGASTVTTETERKFATVRVNFCNFGLCMYSTSFECVAKQLMICANVHTTLD